ncbi:response regulator transcription factor [Pedobacter ureilyticus]|uniref:Response regulator transcription factor n=1 Tax=Pedobacter ureilyticus TaxID=1393051 RepID=A0ABW9JAQ2_9SPHI|nr:response regulator [Pedobacter helvus]
MITALIIEDSRDIRETLAEMLELAGYYVLATGNGVIGMEMAKSQKPDIVLCDIMMPDVDGYTVLQCFRQDPELGNIPFIFMTAKSESSEVAMGNKLGADGYLIKPFDDAALFGVINSKLDPLTWPPSVK